MENLKYWHWMVIGVLLGALFGASRAYFREIDAGEVRTFDRTQFEAFLRRGLVRNLVLHPPIDGQEWVTGEMYQLANKSLTLPAQARRRRNNNNATAPTSRPALPAGEWVAFPLLAADATRKTKPYQTMDGREYLASLQKTYPPDPNSWRDLSYRFAWWEVPRYTMAIYGGVGLVAIGVIWPSIIALMTGVGLVKKREKKTRDYDLSRFNGGKEAVPDAKPEPSQADQDQLAELNAKLEAEVAGMTQGQPTPDIDHDAEAATAVKQLTTQSMDATQAIPIKPEESKEYKGEFYPVVKPGGHKGEGH